METAYLHLITNHIPIIGVPFALAVLLLGIWRSSDEIRTASLAIFVFLGLATLGVYLLGQGGEDFVEDLAGVSHDAIEAHEEAAMIGLASVLTLAAISLFGLLQYGGLAGLRPRFGTSRTNGEAESSSSKSYPRWLGLVLVIAALGSSAVLGYVGRLGGKILHSEFHQTQTASENDQEGSEGDSGRRRGRNRDDR